MQLLLIRHAIAEDRYAFARTGQSDDHRPLTERGRERMKRAAAGLRTLVPELDVLATSPLTRAVETAEIVARAYDDMPIERVDALGSGDVHELAEWLKDQSGADVIAAVGHEPHISDWAAWFLTGGRHGFTVVKKGSAMLLDLADGIRPGGARLTWFAAPAHLRALARAGRG